VHEGIQQEVGRVNGTKNGGVLLSRPSFHSLEGQVALETPPKHLYPVPLRPALRTIRPNLTAPNKVPAHPE
jgi:hypothetical protein